MMIGRRLYVPEGKRISDVSFAAGDYCKDPADGSWHCRPPKGPLGRLSSHTVVEHEDETITVSPSILYAWENEDDLIIWHGYLEHGVWRG